MPKFFHLLQQGFMVKGRTECSIMAFLWKELGLDPRYVEQQIQTIFLDAVPVDEPRSAIVKDGSTLALSAAMPGLAGAVLRKGGPYAAMRSRVKRREGEGEPSSHGVVHLKLFNLLLTDLGPDLLKRGLWIRGKDLKDFFIRQSPEFWARCRQAELNGERMHPARLLEIDWTGKEIFFRLTTP